MTHALQVLHTLQWHHPGGRALGQLAQAPTQDYHSYTHTLLPLVGEVSRDRSRRKIKLREKDAPPAEIKRKIVFSDLRNPPNNFTPLFGEVAKYRTLTEKDEQ